MSNNSPHLTVIYHALRLGLDCHTSGFVLFCGMEFALCDAIVDQRLAIIHVIQ